jgi:hypothetical protein
MVAKGDKKNSDHTLPDIEAIPPESLADPKFYLEQIGKLMALVKEGKIKQVRANQQLRFLKEAYKTVTDEDISDAATRLLSPIDRLSNLELIEHTDAQLTELESAINAVVGIDSKKKFLWLSFIQRTRQLQKVAKSSAITNWIYVGRTSEDNTVFQMGEIHKRFFEVWGDKSVQHTLIMAPPSHGKTVSMTGCIIFDLVQNPRLRVLLWYDTEDKACKEVKVLKRWMRCKRFKALYPHLRVSTSKDDEDSAKRFTITRDNIGSREPSVEAAGTVSQINGDGYDMIVVDDPCPETVAFQPTTREAIIYKFETVVSQRFRKQDISRFRMVCTPWHQEDLAGKIMSEVLSGKRKNWRVAVDEFRVKKDAEGRHISLWPERYPPSYYAERERTLHYDHYARLFELKFSSQSTKIVQSVQFYPCDPSDPIMGELPEAQQKVYRERINTINAAEQWISVDPSATSGRNSSETAATHFALTTDGRAYVRDCWFFPGNPEEMQEWLVDRIVNHGIHRLLIEAQGGMKGTVVLWTAYIMRRLRELKVHWNGSIVECKTQGAKGGQNIGKKLRLKNCAAMIQNGYLRFPGVLAKNWQRGGNVYFSCVDSGNIRKLIRQIVDYPIGTSDGVDTVTQFLIENNSRLSSNVVEPNMTVDTEEIYDSLKDGKRMALKRQRQKKPTNYEQEKEREHEWLLGCLG